MPNGLKWYVLPSKDAESISLRLLVRAGAFHEADDQAGIAHFVEHMLFNGTRHFPAGSLLKLGYSESRNAHTSQEYTVYEQSLPDNNEEKLKNAFLVFQDCAMGMLFDPVEVDKERKVLHEEWRLRKDSIDYWQGFYENLDPARALVKRLPIGTGESILTTPLARIKDYWDVWYRPERMSLYIAGPVDPDRFESLIKEYLGPVVAHGEAPKKEPEASTAKIERLRGAFYTSTSTPDGWFTVHKPRIPENGHSLARLRQQVLDRLVINAWKERMDRLSGQGKLPFSSAYADIDEYWAGSEYMVFGVNRRPGQAQPDFEAFVREAHRVEVHGFTQAEFDFTSTAMKEKWDRLYAQKEDQDNLVDRLEAFDLGKDLLLEPKEEQKLFHTLMNTLRIEDLNAAARTWFNLDGLFLTVGITVDERDLKLPAFLKAAKDAGKSKIEPLKDTGPVAEVKKSTGAAGTISSEATIDDIDTDVWTLSNGSKVFWRKMDGDARIVFRAIRLGGNARLEDAELPVAQMLYQLGNSAGLGARTGAAFREWLKQQGMTFQTWVNDYSEGYLGTSGSDQLEKFLSMVVEEATRQDFDSVGVTETQKIFEGFSAMKNKKLDIAQTAYFQKLLGKINPRLGPMDDKAIAGFNGTKAKDVWKKLYGDASGYSYIICGNADPKTVKDLVVKYLGSIPARDSNVPARPSFDMSWTVPDAGLKNSIFIMGIGSSRVRMVIYGNDDDWPAQNDSMVEAVTIILKNKLFNRIREELGASYDPSVRSWHTGWPKAKWGIVIDFACATGRESSLVKAVKAEIASISQDPLDQATFEKIQETCANKVNPLMLGYDGWAEELEFFAVRGLDPVIIQDLPSKVDELSIASIKSWMQTRLCGNNWLELQIQAR